MTCSTPEDSAADEEPPAVKLGGFTYKHNLSRKTDANKTYDAYTTLGGTVKNALPQSERVKIITCMMPDARQLRVTALSSDELDAAIYIATGQQPSLRPELNDHPLWAAHLLRLVCVCVCVIVLSVHMHARSPQALNNCPAIRTFSELTSSWNTTALSEPLTLCS